MAVKTLITVSTIMLMGLIVAYHALEVQVSMNPHLATTRRSCVRVLKVTEI